MSEAAAPIGVAGAGRMGRGIAAACALAGVRCLLLDLRPRSAEEFARIEALALDELTRDLTFLSSLGFINPERLPTLRQLITVLPAASAAVRVAECEVVFEGLPETLAAKTVALVYGNNGRSVRMMYGGDDSQWSPWGMTSPGAHMQCSALGIFAARPANPLRAADARQVWANDFGPAAQDLGLRKSMLCEHRPGDGLEMLV